MTKIFPMKEPEVRWQDYFAPDYKLNTRYIEVFLQMYTAGENLSILYGLTSLDYGLRQEISLGIQEQGIFKPCRTCFGYADFYKFIMAQIWSSQVEELLTDLFSGQLPPVLLHGRDILLQLQMYKDADMFDRLTGSYADCGRMLLKYLSCLGPEIKVFCIPPSNYSPGDSMDVSDIFSDPVLAAKAALFRAMDHIPRLLCLVSSDQDAAIVTGFQIDGCRIVPVPSSRLQDEVLSCAKQYFADRQNCIHQIFFAKNIVYRQCFIPGMAAK